MVLKLNFKNNRDMKKFLISLVALFATMTVSAQFDGAVGTEGCRAINISNPRIQSWALGVEVQRGFQGNSTTNYASYGKPYNAQGCPDSTTTTCVSLGDGGIALITFSSPIIDGEGEDFCVFENGFNSTYLELGFVEVSSDGEHFYRFPATSYTTYNDIRPELLNNIAGKHEVGWGTPFDLSEIEGDEFFNRNNVRYVRIVDIIGGVDTDSQGNVIYDGTSGGPSTGYDLTGVGVLNQGSSYFVADCEGLLTSADTHELISADNGEMDADGNYRLSYLSNGLLYDALGLYGGMFACGFGPSNHTTSTGVTSYSSASLCGLEGLGNTYMVGYYSDFIGTEEHNVVRKEDDTPFYPIGVYVNNSMSAYNYMNTASFANDGHYLNIIATGYDENGNVTGSSITSLANANNVVKEWKYFDLTPLNECVKVVFTLQTDDDSGYGMNIPAYFCIDAFSYVNTIDTSTPCDAPTELLVSDITENSAEITWNGVADTYELKINGSETETLTTTSKTLTDLIPNTTYTIEVRAVCEEQTSEWVSITFTTLEQIEGGIGTIATTLNTITATIYPNPATDNATMEIVGLDQDAKIVISDLQGRILSQEAISAGTTRYTVNVSNMASGVYYIRIVTDKAVSTQKLIVE